MYDKLTPTENTNQYEAIMHTGIQNLLIKYNIIALIKSFNWTLNLRMLSSWNNYTVKLGYS